MILRFKTKRNMNGNTRYIAIDTDKKEFSRQNWGISEMIDAIEIKSKDFNRIRDEAINTGFAEIAAL